MVLRVVSRENRGIYGGFEVVTGKWRCLHGNVNVISEK